MSKFDRLPKAFFMQHEQYLKHKAGSQFYFVEVIDQSVRVYWENNKTSYTYQEAVDNLNSGVWEEYFPDEVDVIKMNTNKRVHMTRVNDWQHRFNGYNYNTVDLMRSVRVGLYIPINPFKKIEVAPPVKEKAKKSIAINVTEARAAAEFDVANNKHTIKKGLSVEEIEQEILKYIREMYSSLVSGEFEWESRAIGTRSYVVRFQAEDENYGVISVEVDPSTGMPSFYASVEDFLNQN